MEAPERALWLAVILTAFKDADGGCELARHWLSDRSRDMRQVCVLAGLEPDWVVIMARRAGTVPAGLVSPVSPALAPPLAGLLQRLAGLQNLMPGMIDVKSQNFTGAAHVGS